LQPLEARNKLRGIILITLERPSARHEYEQLSMQSSFRPGTRAHLRNGCDCTISKQQRLVVLLAKSKSIYSTEKSIRTLVDRRAIDLTFDARYTPTCV
jgi:hypothetical protein